MDKNGEVVASTVIFTNFPCKIKKYLWTTNRKVYLSECSMAWMEIPWICLVKEAQIMIPKDYLDNVTPFIIVCVSQQHAVGIKVAQQQY